jgi:alpha-1,2-glucosyltransferase
MICVPRLVLDLLPQLSLLACFGAFVLWNGGVVLGRSFPSRSPRLLSAAGDKDNHVASLHLSQMLYIWPFIAFFSWPLLLPQVFEINSLRSRIPRPFIAFTVMAVMVTVVHFNTVVHPFTLADNRHYMFYVFRLLLRHPMIKYAAVPVYFLCAWLVVNALGSTQPNTGERISLVLVWLASTALSLVTAPLVEPRYFMIPWLMWRLHVPGKVQLMDAKTKDGNPNGEHYQATCKQNETHPAIVWILTHLLWIELAWFLLVNSVTCWLFLERPFEWIQEPGKLQRFMW